MSSSDSSDDESGKLLSAVDPDFKLTIDKINGTSVPEPKKSNRPKLKSEDQEQNTFRKHPLYSLEVTPDCRKFIAKQLSSALEKQIKEVRRGGSEVKEVVTGKDGIYLFADSNSPVCEADLQPRLPKKRTKPKIKRRKIDKSDSEDEDSRLKSVAVSSDWVLSKQF